MSKTDSLHYTLCLEGAKWLRRRQSYDRCKAKKPCFSPELCRACRHPYQYVAVELCTVGTENTDEWGLLYWDGKQIRPVVTPKSFDNTGRADMRIMASILRREQFPEKIFNYRGQPSTVRPKTINGIPEKEYYKQQK